MLPEPGDRPRDAVVERHLRRPAEQVVRLADVCDVTRHLAEQRGRDRHLRLDVEFGGDQLGGANERVALAERQVDRLVRDAAVGESFDPA